MKMTELKAWVMQYPSVVKAAAELGVSQQRLGQILRTSKTKWYVGHAEDGIELLNVAHKKEGA